MPLNDTDPATGSAGFTAARRITILHVVNADHTLALTEVCDYISMESAAAHSVTVPPDSSVAFLPGDVVAVRQNGAGIVSILAGAGVTLRPATYVFGAQYELVQLIKTAEPDTWDIIIAGGNGSTGPTVTTVNTQTGDYTLALVDADAYVRINSASPHNVTVPPNASVAFSIGEVVAVRQVGTGAVTIVAGAGVTVNAKLGGSLVLGGQGDMVQLMKVGTNEWDLI